jgi:hypothetical protein
VLSAGPDLVEPGKSLVDDEEFETNSWLLTTAVREVGAVAYRVHSIPDDEEQLRKVIEDQLVRADLIIVSGERQDDSFDLITRTLAQLDANCFIALSEKDSELKAGTEVSVVVLERRYI